MTSVKYGELILEAIDQLRKRKARPDSERICHILQRRHGLSYPDVNEHLDKLVSDGVVIKVDYKGSTSYRNAAKWVRARSQYYAYAESPDISAAVDVLTSSSTSDERPSKSPSIQDIERYLLKKDTQARLNIATLRAKFEKEMKRGLISQLPNGDFIAQANMPNVKKRVKTENSTSSSETSESLQDSCCDYCLLGMLSNRKGVPEKLLVCRDCSAKAHPSCMDYSEEAIAKFSQLSWLCPDCKTCAACFDPGDGEALLFCCVCDKSYHKNCHIPPVRSRPSGRWACTSCVRAGKSEHSTLTKNLFNSDSCDSLISEVETAVDSEFVSQKCLDEYPTVVPLADDWSIREVEMFFRFIGHHAEAPAFREQEIDGQSLLLMKRSDVLTGLSIKLGPALKIYSHIKRLQTVQPSDAKKLKT